MPGARPASIGAALDSLWQTLVAQLSNVASQRHPQLVRALSKGKGEMRPSLPILPKMRSARHQRLMRLPPGSLDAFACTRSPADSQAVHAAISNLLRSPGSVR
jgi:hypothetical protein